ncbi:hypothetical protein K2X85_02950 [bacterium]|nr:hypothetical protein [bacterium]
MIAIFLFGWLTAFLTSTLLVQQTLGSDEAFRLALAWSANLPGSLASLILVEKSRPLPPADRTTMIAAGHPLRLLVALAIALVYWCVILSESSASFWGWFVITYALTLAGDVGLTLRAIRADFFSSPPTRPAVDRRADS